MTGPAPVVRLLRTIPTTRERVYLAWLDPDLLRRWLAPGAFSVGSVSVDPRVGGRVSVQHLDEQGVDVGGVEAEIVELVPDERIVLRWRFVGPTRAVDDEPETLLTVTFSTTGANATQLELVHERLEGLRARDPDTFEGVEDGWSSVLDLLVTTMAAHRTET